LIPLTGEALPWQGNARRLKDEPARSEKTAYKAKQKDTGLARSIRTKPAIFSSKRERVGD